MHQRAPWAGIPRLVAAALLAAACSDLVSPERRAPGAPAFSHTGSGSPALDRVISAGPSSDPTTSIIKGFNPVNPHNGSAIIATFFWLSSESENVITAVTDSLTTGGQRTFVGNTYTEVEYVTGDGISMATYVATNVQGFPDGYGCPPPETCAQDSIYAVAASLGTPVTGAGIFLSAWTGVDDDLPSALGAHRHNFGSASSTTTIGPGPIDVGANSVVYAAVVSNAVVGSEPPGSPFAVVLDPSTGNALTVTGVAAKAEAVAAVQASAWRADPQWTWFFSGPGDWVATGIELKPATTANQAPTAAFTESCSGLTCSFTDGSSDGDGTITAWSWDFGDGTSSTTQHPSHTYAADGTYTVSLTVTDDDGATGTTSKSITVSAANQAPTAAFTVSCSGLTCSFTDGSSDADGSITKWSWDFGDGTSSTAQHPSHTYAAGGTYTVKLTVTDDDGATGTTSKSITVSVVATRLVFTVQPGNTTAASTISPAVKVTATDDAGNTATSFTGNVTVAIGKNPGGGTLSGTKTVAAVSGVATFSDLSINKAGNGYTLVASASGLTGAESATFNITPGPATALVFTGQPSNTYSGATISPAVKVTARDAYGNTATSFTGNVTVAIGKNPPGNGTLSGTKTVAAVSGVATFSDLSINKAGNGYTLVASASGLTGATSAAFDILNRPPSVNAGPDETANAIGSLLYTLSFSFSDRDSNGPWSYTIDWGDGLLADSGTTSSEGTISVSHTYLLPGSYTIRVTVTDNQGASGSDTKVLTVNLL